MGETSNSKWFYQYEDVVINVPEEHFELTPKCWIYETPKRIRQVKEEAYTPKLLSIGPFHYGNKNLAEIEKQKPIYLKKFCERKSKSTLDKLVKFLKEHETLIRKCYAKSFFEFQSSEFIKMILCDAIFIIELFLRRNDFLVKDDLKLDLMLLENQLPFFVLKELYKLASDSSHFLQLACKYFKIKLHSSFKEEIKHFTDLKRWELVKNHPSVLPRELEFEYHPSSGPSGFPSSDPSGIPSSDPSGIPSDEHEFPVVARTKVLTQSLPSRLGEEYPRASRPRQIPRGSILRRNPTASRATQNPAKDGPGQPSQPVTHHPSSDPTVIWMDDLCSATMLREAGIKFRAQPKGGGLLNIKFERKKLHIPLLTVHPNTESQLRNLIAWEQCHYREKAYVCAYVELMDHLINTDADVELLVKEGVLINRLGSATAVADMFNNLLEGVETISPCFENIAKGLIKCHRSSLNRATANLKQVYFNNLLRGTLSVAALLVVLLTIIQTVVAILERVNPTM